VKKTVDGVNPSVVKWVNPTEREDNMSMSESEARKKWQKENTVFIGIKLQKSTDADILRFLEGKQNQTTIKAALREYIHNHPKQGNE